MADVGRMQSRWKERGGDRRAVPRGVETSEALDWPFQDFVVCASVQDDPFARLLSIPYYLSSAARWNLGGVSG